MAPARRLYLIAGAAALLSDYGDAIVVPSGLRRFDSQLRRLLRPLKPARGIPEKEQTVANMVLSEPVTSSLSAEDGGGGEAGPTKRGGGGGGSFPPPPPEQQQQQQQPPVQSKARKLKDRMWVREALEDVTAADFACSIDAAATVSSPGTGSISISSVSRGGGVVGGKGDKKRAVDFENILSRIDARVGEMCVRSTHGDQNGGGACYPLDLDPTSAPQRDQPCYALVPGRGMGSVVYTDEQRDALLMRILASRQAVIEVMSRSEGGVGGIGGGGEGGGGDAAGSADPIAAAGDLEEIRVQLQDDLVFQLQSEILNTSVAAIASEEKVREPPVDLNLYIRDDGTIDWDGAIQDRAAIQKFGLSVWARINGLDPENVDEESIGDVADQHEAEKKVTVKIVETEAIRQEKDRLDRVREELRRNEADHTALLNSAVAAGSAVANIRLASLDPSLRSEIRSSYEALQKKEEEVSFQTLNYELERIFTYLEGEMGNTATTGYIPLQDRLNVAEFGLLESQINSLNQGLFEGDSIDADVLAVVSEQLMDFKRRLGIDYYVTGFTYDQETIQRWLGDLLIKAKAAFAFYVKGGQLFWDDILYSFGLIGRALRGYTLQPREVRTLRRTVKDLINFVPFVIILIIPLTPIGHVLIFGAIQRVFPDFFPSCFTERRQNLLQLYESTEYTEVTINETWQEKLKRQFEAFVYISSNMGKRLNEMAGDKQSTPDGKDQ